MISPEFIPIILAAFGFIPTACIYIPSAVFLRRSVASITHIAATNIGVGIGHSQPPICQKFRTYVFWLLLTTRPTALAAV